MNMISILSVSGLVVSAVAVAVDYSDRENPNLLSSSDHTDNNAVIEPLAPQGQLTEPKPLTPSLR